jgi:hypothetical protein
VLLHKAARLLQMATQRSRSRYMRRWFPQIIHHAWAYLAEDVANPFAILTTFRRNRWCKHLLESSTIPVGRLGQKQGQTRLPVVMHPARACFNGLDAAMWSVR